MFWFDFKDTPPKNTMILVKKRKDDKYYYGIFNSNEFIARDEARDKLRLHKWEIERPERAEAWRYSSEELIDGKYVKPNKENCNWRDESKILTEEKVKEFEEKIAEDFLLERDVIFIHAKWYEIYSWTYLSELDRYEKESIVKAIEDVASQVSRID